MRKRQQGFWNKGLGKGLAGLMVCVILAAGLSACGKEDAPGEGASGGGSAEEGSGGEESRSQEPDRRHVEIMVKDYGTIKVELYREVAPITVDNFLKLTEEGFYDGLTFHRIIKDFMMQGGDPEGTGYGGASETIKGEFRNNGYENNLSHTRGAISMARSSKYDSASSQFFIMHKDGAGLDGEYACFGYVTEGMDVVDAICEQFPLVNQADNGFVEKDKQPVIEYIKVID